MLRKRDGEQHQSRSRWLMCLYVLNHGRVCLENGALGLLADDGWFQCGDNGLVKDVFQSLLRQRRALDVLDRTQLPRQSSPASKGTGRCLERASFSMTAWSSRKSTWVPTIRQGTPGQW